MTPAVSSSLTSGRSDGGGRLQGILAIASMAVAVAVTVVLVATPASSAGSGRSTSASAVPAATVADGQRLPSGLRVEVQGGDPMDAYTLGDRLTALGASLGRIDPVEPGGTLVARTTIVYYDRRSMAAAEQVRSLLGSGTLQRRQVFQPGVDVTIVLGKDLPRL